MTTPLEDIFINASGNKSWSLSGATLWEKEIMVQMSESALREIPFTWSVDMMITRIYMVDVLTLNGTRRRWRVRHSFGASDFRRRKDAVTWAKRAGVLQ